MKIFFLKIPIHSIEKQKKRRLVWSFIWNWVTRIYKEQEWMSLEQMQHGELMTKDKFFNLIYKMFNIMNIRQKWASSIMQKMVHWMSKCEPWIMKSLYFFGKIKMLMWTYLSAWEFKLHGNCNECWNGAIMVKYQWT